MDMNYSMANCCTASDESWHRIIARRVTAVAKAYLSLVATAVVVDTEVLQPIVLDLVSIPSASRFRRSRSRRRGYDLAKVLRAFKTLCWYIPLYNGKLFQHRNKGRSWQWSHLMHVYAGLECFTSATGSPLLCLTTSPQLAGLRSNSSHVQSSATFSTAMYTSHNRLLARSHRQRYERLLRAIQSCPELLPTLQLKQCKE